MKRLALIVALCGAQLAFGQKLTVEQATQQGVENSIGVKAAQSQLRKAQQQTRQAIGSLGFRLDGQAYYERYDAERQFGFGSGAIDANRATLALSYPVDVTGLRQKALKAAKSNESAVEQGISVQTLQAKQDIRKAYYNALRAEWNVQVQMEALQAAKGRLENAKLLYNAGTAARFDVLRFETEVQRAESNLESSQNNVRLAKQVLNNAMSRDVDLPIELETPYSDVRKAELPLYDLAEGRLLQLAFDTRPELKQLASLLRAQEFFTYTERGGLSPGLNLQALYTHTINPNAFTRSNQVTVSATLSFPLWDSGITRARIAAAKEDENQTRLNVERSRLGISLEVKSAVVQLRNATAQIAFALKTVELQTEALRLAELRYNSGEGILLDVTSADADLRAALGALISARADYLIATAALQRAVGTDELPLLTAVQENQQ